jgi:hypothetical protein
MDFRGEVSAFLQAHRARISPEAAGFAPGGKRRVPGLRREEVALLAGVSVDYYIRIERGDLRGVSDDVLMAIARALQLDKAEIEHLFYLASHVRPGARPERRLPSPSTVRPGIQRVLGAMSGAAAWVCNERMDLLAANRLGCAIHVPLFDMPGRPINNARFVFLDPGARDYYLDWERMANEFAAMLRGMPGWDAADQPIFDLIEELLAGSEEFRSRWETHQVMRYRGDVRRLGHPAVGELAVGMEVLDLPTDPGLSLLAYYPEDSPIARERWSRLEAWAEEQPDERFRIGAESLAA